MLTGHRCEHVPEFSESRSGSQVLEQLPRSLLRRQNGAEKDWDWPALLVEEGRVVHSLVPGDSAGVCCAVVRSDGKTDSTCCVMSSVSKLAILGAAAHVIALQDSPEVS